MLCVLTISILTSMFRVLISFVAWNEVLDVPGNRVPYA